MGMGLSIRTSHWENHGGTISAQNSREGTTFFVKLPLVR